MRIVWLLMFTVWHLFSIAQVEKTGIWKYVDPGINMGMNISKFKTDSLEIEGSSVPFIGLFAEKKLDESWDLRLGLNYSMRNSRVSVPFVKYKYKYLDVVINPAYQLIDPLKIEFGFQTEIVLQAMFQDGVDANNLFALPVDKYKRELELFAGLQFYIQNNISLGFRYYFPLNDVSFHNMQILLNVPIKQNPFEKKVNLDEELADRQIIELQEGAILVRLKTYRQVIENLEKEGRFEEAGSLKVKRDEENKEMIAAFRKYYSFSEVYFFNSYDSEKVRAGLVKNIFLNDDLQPDTTITCRTTNYFLAEISTLQANDVGQTSTGIEALVIMDKNFVQLKRPFPFYVKRDEFFMGSRNIFEMVGMMNFNLHEYYKGVLSD
ncbi:MAG: outer membrane beta-barrel protein [Bacteroidetes bacterium]|nr:outer membrane beta-barrel protein [Bacteroidota bacterium]MBL6962451.1 outer membrane beta-barrel protein [Bacteroidota bacterium]